MFGGQERNGIDRESHWDEAVIDSRDVKKIQLSHQFHCVCAHVCVCVCLCVCVYIYMYVYIYAIDGNLLAGSTRVRGPTTGDSFRLPCMGLLIDVACFVRQDIWHRKLYSGANNVSEETPWRGVYKWFLDHQGSADLSLVVHEKTPPKKAENVLCVKWNCLIFVKWF